MMRDIEACAYTVEAVTGLTGFERDPGAWLAEMGVKHNLSTLLAHADDGVIWGQLEGDRLRTSHEAFQEVSPLLRKVTLQQARLFGANAELFVWRDCTERWQARLLGDGKGSEDGWCFDEPQILWGDQKDGDEANGFTAVADGQQGLRHAVPVTGIRFTGSGQRPLRLGVRHYLEADEDGMLHIVHSRLTGLWADGQKEESNGQVA